MKKQKKEFPGIKYIRVRDAYWYSIGYFRCMAKERCQKQCEECRDWNVDKYFEK